ncbi:MAG: hypothetical protein LBM93_05320 [Oscillospiraceae bacterium]|jgi:DNA-directed RNA polymerase subunit RPC12/RpoP|nr:hypothetical protein [Oscillospiraceae bacterium]
MAVITYKCPSCGGEVTYNPPEKGFDCEYCDSFFYEKDIENYWKHNEETDLSKDVNAAYSVNELEELEKYNSQINLYTCSGCGAEITADDTTSATSCCYCHCPVILTGRLAGKYKPDKMIAFNYDKNQAVEIFNNWIKKRWFVPKDFKTSSGDITGIYVPYWLADCNTESSMNALGLKTRSWRKGNYLVTETKEYDVEREAKLYFEDVPIDAAQKIDNELLGAIEPYNYSEFKPFSMAYLSGFLSNKFDITQQDVMKDITKRVEDSSKEYLRSTMRDYSSVKISAAICDIKKSNFEYALLPVWFLNYKYNDKDYEIVVNGQTGKLAGTPPLSIKRLLTGALLLIVGMSIFGSIAGTILSLGQGVGGGGFFFGFIAAMVMIVNSKFSYKFKKQISGTNYLKNSDLTLEKDIHLRTYQTREKVND